MGIHRGGRCSQLLRRRIFGLLDLTWLVIAALFVVFAYGAWNLKTWAWALGIGLTAGSMVLEVIGILTEGQPIAGTLISMAISAVILFCLLRPDVKAAFV